MSGSSYGIDVGGTKIEFSAWNDARRDASPRLFARVATPTHDYATFLTTIAQLVDQADKAVISTTATPLGVALPGLEVDGLYVSANVACLNGRPVRADLAHNLPGLQTIAHDCQCFALAEAAVWQVAGYRRVYGLVLGTGLAGGFCVDGKLDVDLGVECGHIGLPGEFFQRWALPVFACGCGLSGCSEQYASGNGVANIHHHFSGGELESSEVFALAERGDTTAGRSIDAFLDALAAVLKSVQLMLKPDLVVLGGAVAEQAILYRQLPPRLAAQLFRPLLPVPIQPAKSGPSPASRGAAILAANLAPSTRLL